VDGQSSVAAIIERTRDNGMVRGNNTLTFEDGLCRMINLPLDSDVVEGDRVITSGLDDVFPKGIYIGRVIEVLDEKRDMYKTAIIQPGADFQRLEEVLVIRRVVE
jgi:rod shape-determining protein MreC